MTKKISQREARRTRKELREVESKLAALKRRYVATFPGVYLIGFQISDIVKAHVSTALQLGYPVGVKLEGNTLELYAIR